MTENNTTIPPQPPAVGGAGNSPAAPPMAVMYPPPPWWVTPPNKSFARSIFGKVFILLFILSVLLNIELGILLYIRIRDAGTMDTFVLDEGEKDQVVAVFSVAGVIDAAAVQNFGLFYRQVRYDEDIKAVVIRVNSPGGGVSASDQIYMMVKSIREDFNKPVVVSMGGVAASGGYYISAPADKIVAEPTTVTGSIGVIASWFILKGTLEKIGAEPVIMRSRHSRGWKAAINPFQKPDDRQRAYLQKILDDIQVRFENVVTSARGGHLKPREAKYRITVGEGEEAREIVHTETEPFNGKAYLANEALALGLIDKIGYSEDAVRAAAELAGLDKPKVVQYQQKKSLLERAFGAAKSQPLIDVEAVEKLTAPRIMMLWKPE